MKCFKKTTLRTFREFALGLILLTGAVVWAYSALRHVSSLIS